MPRHPKMDYVWHLRQLMAMQGMFSTSDLVPHLAERGVVLSTTQVFRLVTQRPERLNLTTLAALCDILDCTPNDLIETIVAAPKKKAAAARASEQELDENAPRPRRPRRAHIRDAKDT